MRRWIAFSALMLLLGAASTWAIAWFAAGIGEISVAGLDIAKGRVDPGWVRSIAMNAAAFGRAETVTASTRMLEPEGHRGPRILGFRDNQTYQTPESLNDERQLCDDDWVVFEASFGWPLRALRSVDRYPVEPRHAIWMALRDEPFNFDRGLIAGGLDIQVFGSGQNQRPNPMVTIGPLQIWRGEAGEVLLPCRPVALGFIADMIVLGGFWAAAVLMLSMGHRAMQLRRRRRHRCSWCKHRQAAIDVQRCAECGRDPRRLDALVTHRTLVWSSTVLCMVLIGTVSFGGALHAMASMPTEIESAARRGDTIRVQTLIQGGSSVASSDPCVTPLLAWAAAGGNTSTMQAIIDAGAALDSGVDCAPTALEAAIVHGQRAAINLLIDAGALDERAERAQPSNITVADRAFAALHLAAAGGDADTISAILDRRQEMLAEYLRPGEQRRSLWTRFNLLKIITSAARVSEPAALTVIVERIRQAAATIDGIDASVQIASLLDGSDALRSALRWRRIEQVHLLVKLGAPLENETYGTAFVGAFESGDPDMVKLVFDVGGGPILMKHDPIVWALRAQSPEIVRLLIANGARINASNADGLTPFGFAVRERFPVEWLRLLVDLGADPALACKGLPIEHCIDWQEADDESIEFLRSVAPFFAEGEERGGKLLVRAMDAGQVRGVERLLHAGADPHDRVDYWGSAANVAKEIVSGEWVPSNTTDHESARRAAQLVNARAQQVSPRE